MEPAFESSPVEEKEGDPHLAPWADLCAHASPKTQGVEGKILLATCSKQRLPMRRAAHAGPRSYRQTPLLLLES